MSILNDQTLPLQLRILYLEIVDNVVLGGQSRANHRGVI